ncbi:type I 3-dehydroquinate dehydratase, partial [Streptococcus pyogenes]
DVLTLLTATAEMYARARRPLITMSMGALGMVSRVSGEVFGSSATFGAAAKASAPGQVPVAELRTILSTLKLSNEE